MLLSILTPHRKLITEQPVEEVFLPGFKGQLDVLENHANLITPLETGVMKWRKGTAWQEAAISKGILEIFDGHISVMAEVSELSEEIDVARAKQAETVARKKLEEGGLDNENFRKYELKLQRAMARQQAAT